MKTFRRSLFLALLLLVSPSLTLPLNGHASSGTIKWSPRENLSQSGEDSSVPAIEADRFGYVHVVWSEAEGGGPHQRDHPVQPGNTIFYTRWDGANWTPPSGVVFVPGDNFVNSPALASDLAGNLHLVWTGMSQLYYSRASVRTAPTPQGWSSPVALAADIARSEMESDIAADEQGVLHVAYATNMGVDYIRSSDGGGTWSTPETLAPIEIAEDSLSSVRVTADQIGGIHVTWTGNDAEGHGIAVHYMRWAPDLSAWSSAITLSSRAANEYDTGKATLAVFGPGTVHVIYNHGVRAWKYHRISYDGGGTWGPPEHILTGLEGDTGFSVPLVDGRQNLHLIVAMRTISGQIHGIQYTSLTDKGWIPPELVVLDQSESSERVAAAIAEGNAIHVVWQGTRDGEVYHVSGQLPEQAIDPLPLPTVLSGASHGQVPGPTRTTVAVGTAPTPSRDWAGIPPPAHDNYLGWISEALLVSLVPILILLGVVGWRRVRQQGSHS